MCSVYLSFWKKMEKFTCDVCQAKFSRRSSLFNHRNVHDQNPKHTCSLCGAAFRWKVSLKSHLQSHARKRKTEEKLKPFNHQNIFRDNWVNIEAQEQSQEPSENGSSTEKLEAAVKVEEVIVDKSNGAEIRNDAAFYNEINVPPETYFAEVLVMNDYEIVIENEKTYTVMKNMDFSKNTASTQNELPVPAITLLQTCAGYKSGMSACAWICLFEAPIQNSCLFSNGIGVDRYSFSLLIL
ncbi:Zinc finger protein [Trichinella pseudospiralis]